MDRKRRRSVMRAFQRTAELERAFTDSSRAATRSPMDHSTSPRRKVRLQHAPRGLQAPVNPVEVPARRRRRAAFELAAREPTPQQAEHRVSSVDAVAAPISRARHTLPISGAEYPWPLIRCRHRDTTGSPSWLSLDRQHWLRFSSDSARLKCAIASGLAERARRAARRPSRQYRRRLDDRRPR